MPASRKPEGQKVTRNKPTTAETQEAPAGGWRFGDHPAPEGLLPESEETWEGWFESWWSAMWTPADLPGLRVAIRAYDGHLRGSVKTTALLPLLEQYGITPKGRKLLAWLPPKDKPVPVTGPTGRDRLRVVDAS